MSKAPQALKQLQARRDKLHAEILLYQEEANQTQQKLKKAQDQLNQLEQRIAKIAQAEPIVSEHAMLRYLERVQGVDLKAIQKAILSDAVKGMIMQLPNGKFPIGNGFRAIVRNRTVVTVESN